LRFLGEQINIKFAILLILYPSVHAGAAEKYPEQIVHADSFQLYVDALNKHDNKLHRQFF
jgi:hypothetical protein